MTATLIEPLRKRDVDGEVYTRLPDIQAKLAELCVLAGDEISRRCGVQDPESADYLPSECLVHLVRRRRSEPFDAHSEILFKTLMERVLCGLPKGENREGTAEKLSDSNVRDEGRHRFVLMLMKDRQNYFEALDIYEVRFQKPLQKLRFDAQRKVYRRENPRERIEIDHETGEIAEGVERAAGSFDRLDWDAYADFQSLLVLDEAITALAPLQKAIVEMDRKGIPIESKEPGVVNISNVLGKTPKTIRKHRDLAYATLRAVLTKGE